MKRNEIMTKIREDVKEQMYQCLFAGMDRMYFEGEYGNGVVQVDLHEVRATSFEIVDVQCFVLHFDGKERIRNYKQYCRNNSVFCERGMVC